MKEEFKDLLINFMFFIIGIAVGYWLK